MTATGFSPLDVWIEGKYGSYRVDSRNSDQDGYFGLLTVGMDYVLSPSVLIGTFAQFNSMRLKSETDRSSVDGTGWMAGPYATVKLADELYLQGRLGWGRSNNDISPLMTYTDSFGSTRWLASAALTGRYRFSNLLVQPRVQATYFEDKSDSYRDTFGVMMPAVRTRFGQVKMGPEFSYHVDVGSGITLEPRIATNLIWNFASETSAAGVPELDGLAAGPDGVRGQLELGLRATDASGVTLELGGSYDGIGSSEYSAITGRAGLRLPLN